MKNTTRTFIAVETSAAVRRRTEDLIEELRAAPAEVKWVEEHNRHLTLQFLGEAPTQEIHEVCRAVERAAAAVQPFELELCGAGAFPSASRPRTLWLGTARGKDEMVALHDRIEAALKKLGFRPEGRRFEPHLTIGRVRSGGPALAELGQLLKQHAEFDAGHTPVTEAVVFSSQLRPDGPIYSALCRAKLGGK